MNLQNVKVMLVVTTVDWHHGYIQNDISCALISRESVGTAAKLLAIQRELSEFERDIIVGAREM